MRAFEASELQWKQYEDMMYQDGHQNPESFWHYLGNVFQDVELNGKKILDIGSGKGLMSLYAALKGAGEVVSLEPEMSGSTSGTIELQRKRVEELGLENVRLIERDFFDLDDREKFDIVMSFASINHLYETPLHAEKDAETYSRYLEIARKFNKLLDKNGVAVITDACCYGFFFFLKNYGIHRPWRRGKKTNVNYRLHQNPSLWRKIFLDAGCSEVRIHYPIPFACRNVKPLVDNPLANFFLKASFILHCYT